MISFPRNDFVCSWASIFDLGTFRDMPRKYSTRDGPLMQIIFRRTYPGSFRRVYLILCPFEACSENHEKCSEKKPSNWLRIVAIPGWYRIQKLLSAQTQFFQTQFSTFWFFGVDQHSEWKPPFPQLLLKLSLSSFNWGQELVVNLH